MSGGAFNYLYSAELFERQPELVSMRDYLHEKGHHDAALRTAEVLATVDKIRSIQAELGDVWKSAEWVASCDYEPAELLRAVEKWRASGKPPPADRIDVARRLYELEREAARLRRSLGAEPEQQEQE